MTPPLAPPDDALQTVLYVEDHPGNVLLMQALLSRRPGVRLVVATTADEGWHAALAHRPDLLLLDLRLPDGHGAHLLQRLREVPHLAAVPAVALTADDGAGLTGFDELWPKPMAPGATLARLDRLLQRPRGASVGAAPGWPPAAARGERPDPIPFPAGA